MMVKLAKILIFTVIFALISGLVFTSQVADDPAQTAHVASFGEYMYGGKTADALAAEMALTGELPDGIYGVELGTAAFLGETERGPVIPQAVTSFEEYARIFGSYPGRSYMPYAVKGFFDNGGRKLYVARVISQTAEKAQASLKNGKINVCTLYAINAGEWGNRIAVKVSEGMHSTETDPTFMLEVLCYTRDKFAFQKSGSPDPAQADIIEVYNDVSFRDESVYHYALTVNQKSSLIKLGVGENDDTSTLPAVSDKPVWLAGGSDGDLPVLDDFLGHGGQDGKPATGLSALERIPTISTLYSPVSCIVEGLDQALIRQCETLGDRMVIMDTALNDPKPTPWSTHVSSYAACFTPWVQVTGFDSRSILVPPGGFIAGLYARNDYIKGPNKAPVNEVLVGVKGLETELLPQARKAQAIRRVNPIKNIEGIGFVANEFGTLSDLADAYGLIHLRRYVNFLRDSIDTSLFWVSGMEWTQDLQSTVKHSIEDFLDREWKRGALLGSTQIEAYYVRIYGQQTSGTEGVNPPADIEIGVALSEPSQYLVFHVTK